MFKKISLAMALLIIVTTLASCNSVEQNSKEPNNEVKANQNLQLPTSDRAGNEITIPTEINRIVSISPANTEMIIELGFGDKLIAVDTYSTDIEGVPENATYFDMMNPDIEKLVALEPDIIYATGMSMAEGNDPFKPLKNLGITVAYIPSSDSIDAIYNDIMFIAESLSVKEKGEEIINNMKLKISKYREFGSTIEDKKTVYFELAGEPQLYSFGNGVFLNEMIEIIGAKNILADQNSWLAVSNEVIVAANPDFIFTNVDYIENAAEAIKNRVGWENITAIKNNDVYYIDNDSSSLPNHNIIKALEQMAKAVYPEVYKNEN